MQVRLRCIAEKYDALAFLAENFIREIADTASAPPAVWAAEVSPVGSCSAYHGAWKPSSRRRPA
jgi:hypothetical protein